MTINGKSIKRLNDFTRVDACWHCLVWLKGLLKKSKEKPFQWNRKKLNPKNKQSSIILPAPKPPDTDMRLSAKEMLLVGVLCDFKWPCYPCWDQTKNHLPFSFQWSGFKSETKLCSLKRCWCKRVYFIKQFPLLLSSRKKTSKSVIKYHRVHQTLWRIGSMYCMYPHGPQEDEVGLKNGRINEGSILWIWTREWNAYCAMKEATDWLYVEKWGLHSKTPGCSSPLCRPDRKLILAACNSNLSFYSHRVNKYTSISAHLYHDRSKHLY